MLKEMKKQLADNIHKAKESGELTAHQLYDITRKSISESTQQLKEGAIELREITKEAVTTSVQVLVEAEEASEEKIAAVLHGVIDGIKQAESHLMESTQKELGQAKKLLLEKEATLAKGVSEALEGAKEAAGNFSDQVKTNIETALSDTKLRSTELLGLTKETVKGAVRKAIETGSDVEETVEKVTREATAKAMEEASFTAERARNISETVLSAAVEAAEELGSHVSETASAAAEGVRKGLTDSVEFTRESLAKAGEGVKGFVVEDLEQTKDDLEAVGGLFVETLRKVADQSGNVAKEILHELADDAKKAGSSLQEKALAASRTAATQLKALGSEALEKTEEVGGKAAHAVSEEVKELSERMLAVAKGAATGMWEGAKAAFNKETDKEDKEDKS